MKLYALTAAFRKARLYSYLHELYFLARAPASYPVCVWTPSLVPQIKQVEIYIHVSNQAGSNALNYITWLQNRWPWAISISLGFPYFPWVAWKWLKSYCCGVDVGGGGPTNYFIPAIYLIVLYYMLYTLNSSWSWVGLWQCCVICPTIYSFRLFFANYMHFVPFSRLIILLNLFYDISKR